MDVVRIERGDPRFPVVLRELPGQVAPSLATLGNPDLLSRFKLALFCSASSPGSVILHSYDLVQRLRQTDLAALGGFHSPMEREWLAVLLRGPAPVVACPARSIEGMRLPAEHRQPLREGRLLILSCFPDGPDRPTVEMAVARNRFVAALSDAVFVAHAAPGGKTERFCLDILAWGKPLYTLEDPANSNLVGMGAIPLRMRGGEPLPWR